MRAIKEPINRDMLRFFMVETLDPKIERYIFTPRLKIKKTNNTGTNKNTMGSFCGSVNPKKITSTKNRRTTVDNFLIININSIT